MTLLFELFWSFFRIGLFSFGGGYAMIPLIQSEIVQHGWLTVDQFADIIAIAEITPGPIAVNSATYVGYETAGILGSACATVGVTLPSLLLILLVSGILTRVQDHPLKNMIFYGIRPVVVGLIASAAFFIGKSALVRPASDQTVLQWLTVLLHKPQQAVFPAAVLIFIATLLIELKFKVHPLLLIIGAGITSVLLHIAFSI